MSQPPQDRPQDQPEGRPQGQQPSGPGPQQPGQGMPPGGYPQGGYPQGTPQGGMPPGGYPRGGYPQPGPQGYPPQGGYPGQPGQPGPQGFAGGPYGPAQPGGPYGAGAQPPSGQPPYGQPSQPQGGKKRTGLFVLIGAGALALVLAVVAVAVNLGGRDDSADGSGNGGTTQPTQATKPSDAVQGFLDAVAANDSARALGYLYEQPSDTTFLTDEALAASNKIAPLSAISVPEVKELTTDGITASFTLGDKTYSHKFTPFRDGDDWKLYDGVSEVSLSGRRAESLPMLVNGTKVTADSLFLAPGTYEFTSSSKWISYGSSNRLVVGATDYPRLADGFRPTLTKAGSAAALSETKSAFKTCLGKHELKPKGCPNHVDRLNGIKVKESTVRWRVAKDPFRNAKFRLDYSDPSTAEANFYPQYRIKFQGSKDGRSGTVDSPVIGAGSFSAIADFSGSDVKVKLER